MTTKVAINGFGRIGRLVLRGIIESGRTDIEVVGINDLGDAEMNSYLLRRDSVHGPLKADVSAVEGGIMVNGKKIAVSAERNPADLPWGKLGVDIAMECTGIFTARDKAALHLKAGAKKVLISAPGKDSDLTVVYGVNHDKLEAGHDIVSNASCTTNCLAPVAKVMNDTFGITKGYMTTIHAYTGDQCILDSLHSDPRRARAAGLSMIPTSTGAAKAVGLVLPELQGKLDGSAVRVPTPNVSLVDLKFVPGKNTTVEEVNAAIKAAAEGPMKGILAFIEEPTVSIDYNHDAHSSSFDSTQTQVMGGDFVRVVSWYDNEWGFSNRMADTAVVMGKLI